MLVKSPYSGGASTKHHWRDSPFVNRFAVPSKSKGAEEDRAHSQPPCNCRDFYPQPRATCTHTHQKQTLLEKYYKTLPLAPVGQRHCNRSGCSRIPFRWLPLPFSSPSAVRHICFSLYCAVGLAPWRFSLMRRSRQRSKEPLSFEQIIPGLQPRTVRSNLSILFKQCFKIGHSTLLDFTSFSAVYGKEKSLILPSKVWHGFLCKLLVFQT